MKRTINVRLNPQSIADAITELQMYKEEIERRVRLLVQTLIDNGCTIARAKIAEYDAVYSGELLNSINGYMDESIGIIRVDSEYALFVEFGTGPVGKKEPHELADESFYRPTPWYTKADRKPMDEIYGWKPIETDDGNIIYMAAGQKSKPFMYDTAKALRDKLPSIAREVFG